MEKKYPISHAGAGEPEPAKYHSMIANSELEELRNRAAELQRLKQSIQEGKHQPPADAEKGKDYAPAHTYATIIESTLAGGHYQSALLGYVMGRDDTMKATPTRPVWVKARQGMKDGIYNMKCICAISGNVMLGVGLVTNAVIVMITFLNKSSYGKYDLPDNYEGIFYLDEGGEKEVKP